MNKNAKEIATVVIAVLFFLAAVTLSVMWHLVVWDECLEDHSFFTCLFLLD